MAEVGEYVSDAEHLRRIGQDPHLRYNDAVKLMAAADAIEALQRERDRAELTACFTVEDLEAELRHCWAFMSWLDGALVDRDWPAIPEAVQRLKAALRPVSALDGSAAVSVPHSDHTEQTEEEQ